MDPFTMMMLAGAGTSILQGFMGAEGADDAAAAQAAGFQRGRAAYDAQVPVARDAINAGADKAAGYIDPYVKGGQQGFELYKDAIGVNGADAQKRYHDGFQDDPGFQAALDQGRREIEHSSLFRGRSDSGATMKELYAYGETQRLGAFNSRLDRLSQLSNLGLSAGGQAAGIEQGRGSALANLALGQGTFDANAEMGIGTAEAGGITGRTNAITGAIGGIGSSIMIGGGAIKDKDGNPTGKQALETVGTFFNGAKNKTANSLYGGLK